MPDPLTNCPTCYGHPMTLYPDCGSIPSSTPCDDCGAPANWLCDDKALCTDCQERWRDEYA